MIQWYDAEGFHWDRGYIEKNWEKHKVTHIECEEVFFNKPLIVGEDKAHSKSEMRFYALGKTMGDRYRFIVFTLRNKKIRVISARGMNKKERKLYDEEIEKITTIQE